MEEGSRSKALLTSPDSYYIDSKHFPTQRPTLFVPEYQLQALLQEINNHFPEVKTTISDELRDEGLVISFDDLPFASLRPRFLGHSTSRDQIDSWQDNIAFDSTMESIPERSLEAFKAKMEAAQEIAKNRNKAAKKKRQDEQIVRRQDMVRMVTRAQRYLGLNASVEDVNNMPNVAGLSVSPVMVDNVAPFAFDADVVFIAVDVEAYERAPRPITEIGIATLDTRDIKGKAPGPNGSEWQKSIRAVHLRIVEHMRLVNSEFVEGCPDKFEFGKSTLVGEDKLPQTIAACFKQPFSGPEISDERRNIVLVGHDISQDINYLRQVGYSVTNCGNLRDTVDTAHMFRVYTKDPNARSLGHMLYHFDLEGWHLHNAGNDAVYTLWAMLAMCVSEASERGSDKPEEKHQEIMQARTDAAVATAKGKVADEMEGWQIDSEDGGVPLNKPMFGPPRPGGKQYFTPGGALLDV